MENVVTEIKPISVAFQLGIHFQCPKLTENFSPIQSFSG